MFLFSLVLSKNFVWVLLVERSEIIYRLVKKVYDGIKFRGWNGFSLIIDFKLSLGFIKLSSEI